MTRNVIIAKLAANLDRKIVKMARGGSELQIAGVLTQTVGRLYLQSRDPAVFDTFCAAVLCENKRRAAAGVEALPLPPRS